MLGRGPREEFVITNLKKEKEKVSLISIQFLHKHLEETAGGGRYHRNSKASSSSIEVTNILEIEAKHVTQLSHC